MNDHQSSSHFWARLPGAPESPATRAALATIRRGIGKEPGTVPAIWPYYSTLDASGTVTHKLRAEHTTMCLFSLHMQSHPTSVHRRGGMGLGEAMRHYRRNVFNATPDRDPENTAVDKRMAAIASSTTYRELEEHLRRAFSLMRKEERLQLDYDRLFQDLLYWQNPQWRPGVVRRWGSEYFVARPSTKPEESPSQSQKGESNA